MIPLCRIENISNGRAWCNDCNIIHAGHILELSQAKTAKGDSWRAFSRKIPQPEAKKPSKVWNYLKALFFHAVSGFGYASWPVVWKRRRLCNTCPQRDPVTDSCKSCGCSLHGTILGDKLRWKSSQCPLGKW